MQPKVQVMINQQLSTNIILVNKIDLKTLRYIFITKEKEVQIKTVKTKDDILLFLLKSKVLKIITKSAIINTWVWLQYLQSSLGQFSGYPTKWIFTNIAKLTNNDFFYKVWYKFYKKHNSNYFFSNKYILINWFCQLSFFKDSRGIILFFKKLLLHTTLKKHKKIFFIIKVFFKFWFLKVKKKHKIKGYSFFFKGKLGKKGSVRKQKLFVKNGLTSFTNKNLRVNYEIYYIWTHTGVIGAGVSIFF